MKAHFAKISLALLSAAFLLGCQEQGSEPVGPDTEIGAPNFLHQKNNPKPHGGGDGGGETFNATVETAGGGPVWTGGEQEVQTADAKNWLHIFDSGGNGTRGNPNYDNAAFSTEIFLQPLIAEAGNCEADPANMPGGLTTLLFGKLDQGLRNVVFDFQVNYDIADNPEGFSFFLFRWKENDGRIFSASTGFGLDGSDPAPTIVFLGDDDSTNDPDLIDDPTKTRVFRISGAKVIARELRKNKVIATLVCPNEHVIDVTVAPI